MALISRLRGLRIRRGRRRKLRSLNSKKEDVPVDGRDMPIGYRTMLVIDEYGGLGESPEPHETTFGYAVAVVDDPKAFADLTAHNRPEGSKVEVKASRDPNRMAVTERIAALGPVTYGFFLDKSDPPSGWRGSEARDKMIGTLDLALGDVLRDNQGNIYVVVDNHTVYRGELAPAISLHSNGGRMVAGDKYESKSGQFSGELQTVDYVASSLRGQAEFGDDTRTRKLGMKVRRIAGDDSIRRRI